MLTDNFLRLFSNTMQNQLTGYQDCGEGSYGIYQMNELIGCNDVIRRGRNDAGSRALGWYVMIGTGNTAPTKTDIHLDNIIDLAPTSTSLVVGTDNILKKVIHKFTNTTDDALVIKEIGLGYGGKVHASWPNNYFMCARKLLDTPVTMQPGETYQFSYTIGIKSGG